MITPKTRLIGILGNPVSHSLSPAMQNAALRKLDFDARYLAFPVERGKLREALEGLKALGAIVNFEVYPDPELNTASQLEQGRVYWNIRFTDVPPAENPTFRVEVTNQWITEVLDI